jgi:hypothetical protein
MPVILEQKSLAGTIVRRHACAPDQQAGERPE